MGISLELESASYQHSSVIYQLQLNGQDFRAFKDLAGGVSTDIRHEVHKAILNHLYRGGQA